MFIDPLAFYAMMVIGYLPALFCLMLAIVIFRGRTVGGLTFCRFGRFRFQFSVRNAS